MNEKKITFIVLGILVVGLIVSGLSSATYALFSTDDYGTNLEAYNTGLLAIEAKSKSDIISLSNALPMTDEDGLETTPYVFTIKNIGNLDYQFDVKLLSKGSEEVTFPSSLIKLQINDGEVTTLANLTDGKLNTDKITLLAGETIDFSIRIWLSIDTTNEYIGRTFDSEIVTDGQAIYTSSNNEVKVNLKDYITSLYLSNKDETLVERNGISYRYASSVRLMNDRQGTMDVGEDDGNIRYYGSDDLEVSDDLKNYIYFNCSDYTNQSADTCEVWRIMGIIDGKIKIMRDKIFKDSSGNSALIAWDQDKNIDSNLTSYSNNWEESSLQMLLNNSYYNGDTAGTVIYYSGESGEEATTFDMSSIGIKNQETRNLISESTWYLAGLANDYRTLYADDVYISERTNSTDTIYGDAPFTMDANIGLMYASDYGYASDLKLCSVTPYSYDSDTVNCKNTNWIMANYNTAQWMITPSSENSVSSHLVVGIGSLGTDWSYKPYRVRPVLYLDPEASFIAGDGSQDEPFELYVNYPVSSILKLGDYISYTPSSTSYTTDTTYTGDTNTQTINPSELNLWRVLSINDDGTVDIISEHASSAVVYFRGQTGYQNLVGYLNVLASQYETEGITVGSRHFGYDGQTEYITDTTYFASTTAPWACSTEGICSPDPDDYEASGGGDTLYLTDYNLVYNVLGKRVVTNALGMSTTYWMASRYYSYGGSTRWYFNGRYVNTSGSNSYYYLYIYSSGTFSTNSNGYSLRPIVTLSSEVPFSRVGTEGNHYKIMTGKKSSQ